MDKEPRKASDVLLDLENKIDTLLSIVRTQDLTIKIISNKLNELMTAKQTELPRVTVEAVSNFPNFGLKPPVMESEKKIPISTDFQLPLEEKPSGFRRTSRPETYEGDNSYLRKETVKTVTPPKYPTQIPKPSGKAEVVVPNEVLNKTVSTAPTTPQQNNVLQNAVPVSQRIVDRNGKSVFLADVEVIDLSTQQVIFRTRTGATGKWQAALGVGDYKTIIRKRETLTKEKIEITQDVHVTGQISPLELQTMIIK